MKKHRKQVINVSGKIQIIDVPIDHELYKADCHAEYQRARSKAKEVSLYDAVRTDLIADVIEDYEKTQLIKSLYKAIKTLTEKERQLIGYIYFERLTEHQASVILGISQQAVSKQKHRILIKLRNMLIDWV